MAFSTKVYVVQQFPEGKPGNIIAAKLTFAAAHAIAKKYAPAKVHIIIADKGDEPNGMEQEEYQKACNQLQFELALLP